jgi:hypothetical protein
VGVPKEDPVFSGSALTLRDGHSRDLLRRRAQGKAEKAGQTLRRLR